MTSPNLVQETNIERILEDHLWSEISMIEAEIAKIMSAVSLLEERREKLIKIAEAANIASPI